MTAGQDIGEYAVILAVIRVIVAGTVRLVVLSQPASTIQYRQFHRVGVEARVSQPASEMATSR
jgi:hypothetical protein